MPLVNKLNFGRSYVQYTRVSFSVRTGNEAANLSVQWGWGSLVIRSFLNVQVGVVIRIRRVSFSVIMNKPHY